MVPPPKAKRAEPPKWPYLAPVPAPRAQDITGILEYIAADNTLAARRFREEVYSAIRGVVSFPGTGHRRGDSARRGLAVAQVSFWPALPHSAPRRFCTFRRKVTRWEALQRNPRTTAHVVASP
jgi:plasmid stabilization system protein ParE